MYVMVADAERTGRECAENFLRYVYSHNCFELFQDTICKLIQDGDADLDDVTGAMLRHVARLAAESVVERPNILRAGEVRPADATTGGRPNLTLVRGG